MVSSVTSVPEFDKHVAESSTTVVFFWADWSEPCKFMDKVFGELSKQHRAVRFLKVEAEVLDDITIKYNVTAVPMFVILQGGKVLDRVEGADAPLLSAKLQEHAGKLPAQSAAQSAAAAPDAEARVRQLLRASPVLLFMKGSPDAPRCGFSRKVVDALRSEGVSFSHFDILQDEDVRTKLKEISQWPTYPQLYVNEELIGGCDIIMELQATNELKQEIDSRLGTTTDPTARIKELIHQQPVMLFMKGSPAAPRCGFSRKVVDELNKLQVKYGTFDILTDESVRQGVKEYSSWPTYPQLYVNGELLGGCDIVLEMAADGELAAAVKGMDHSK